MTIYTGNNYRKIYKQHHGPIPKDENGRRYDIHHIDGDHTNNLPDNLIAIPIQEHYDIHYAQKDYGACFLIAPRLKMSANVLSELASKRNKQQLENGTHVFQSGMQTKNNLIRSQNGTHPFLGGNVQRDMHRKNLENGTHFGKMVWTCPHCGKNGRNKSNYTRYHGSNCKSL